MKKNLFLSVLVTALFIGAVIFFKKGSDRESAYTSETISSQNVKKKSEPMSETQKVAVETKVSAPVSASSIDFSKELDELPTIQDMKELSEEEVHHTPEAVKEGGRVIGRMIENAEKHPELRDKTVNFLFDCAQNNDLVNSIRAVCWKSTLTQMKSWNIFVPLANVKIPPRVLQLSSQLP